MNATDVIIRKLSPKDGSSYRVIRLEALHKNPEAFGSSYDLESNYPLSWFEDRLEKNTVFGAFIGNDLIGVVGFYVQQGQKMNHKGVLWGMYVRSEARGKGVGCALIEEVTKHAAKLVEMIQLTVVSDNNSAKELYRRCMFDEYGLEKHALKFDGQYYDEVHMVRFLNGN